MGCISFFILRAVDFHFVLSLRGQWKWENNVELHEIEREEGFGGHDRRQEACHLVVAIISDCPCTPHLSCDSSDVSLLSHVLL